LLKITLKDPRSVKRSAIGALRIRWRGIADRSALLERIVLSDRFSANLFSIPPSVNIDRFYGSHNHHAIFTAGAIKGLDFSTCNSSTLEHVTVTAAIHSMLSAQGIPLMICTAGLMF
jgi:hypothetical protein